MRVRIPTPLRSYTSQRPVVEAGGVTVRELLDDLDRQFPGMAFRVVDEQGRLRTHMRVYLDQESTRDLDASLEGVAEVTVMQALSGG